MRGAFAGTALLAACVSACDAPQSPAAPRGPSLEQAATRVYEITDLGTLGGDFSEALHISNSGQIVGFSYLASGARHPFIWRNGTMTDIDVGGSLISVNAVNDRGQVIGTAFRDGQYFGWLWADGVLTELPGAPDAINNAGQIAGSTNHAYLWTNGVMQDLGTLGGSYSVAFGLNNRGQVVGLAERADHSEAAVLWENGSIHDLGLLGEPRHSVVINDAGIIAGTMGDAAGHSHAFLWDGVLHDLGELPWGEGGVAAINNRGQVIGTSFRSGSYYAFVWQDGAFTSLSPLPGTWAPSALQINSRGEIAGSSGNEHWAHGIVWRDDQMYDLGTLGGSYSVGFDINDAGIVVGYASDSTGKIHPVMWRPAGKATVAAQ